MGDYNPRDSMIYFSWGVDGEAGNGRELGIRGTYRCGLVFVLKLVVAKELVSKET